MRTGHSCAAVSHHRPAPALALASRRSFGEGTANPGGIDYRYIVKSLIPIGFALFFMQSLSEAIKSYFAWRST